jgi:hypothetical protein
VGILADGATVGVSELVLSGKATLLWFCVEDSGEGEESAGAKSVWMAARSSEVEIEREFAFGFEIASELKSALFNLEEERIPPSVGARSAVFEVGWCWLSELLEELLPAAPEDCGEACSALTLAS